MAEAAPEVCGIVTVVVIALVVPEPIAATCAAVRAVVYTSNWEILKFP